MRWVWRCRQLALCLGVWVGGPATLLAQGHDWWANNVGWDGRTHWSRYLSTAPRYLGPNALPIPRLSGGRVGEDHRLELRWAYQTALGDQTQQLALGGYCVASPQKLAFEAYWIPWEHFQTSHEWKTTQRIFHTFYEENTAVGDVYLFTHWQVGREPRWPVDAALRLGYRFPASTQQGAARFTDNLGYSLDLNLGKTLGAGRWTWRALAQVGIYVWPTNVDNQYQDDAFLYGLGLATAVGSWQLEGSWRGYYGYLGNGDRPQAWRLALDYTFARGALRLGWQQGAADNLYRGGELGWVRRWGKLLPRSPVLGGASL